MEKKITPIVESYNVEEEFMYNKTYLFIKGYAVGKNLKYTLKALPLARKIHNGQYRKGIVSINGKDYKVPYFLHCLKVCSTLISLNLPLTNEELDILCACAILHDSVEDNDEMFTKGGIELVNDYGFPKEVYEIIRLLSKHSGADEYELSAYFNEIKKNKLALLIKLADRSHNVEDLYNMKIEKLYKYILETKKYFLKDGLCSYGKANYPELSNGITIMKAKIISLTELTDTLVHRYEEQLKEKDEEIRKLREELEKNKFIDKIIEE